MIYFVEMEGSKAIKIGFTANDDVSRRLAQLQTGQPARLNLLGTIPGDMAAEKALHAEFAGYRANGEWFEGPPIFRRFLEYMITNQTLWTFSRAFALLEDFVGDLTDENERLKGLLDQVGRNPSAENLPIVDAENYKRLPKDATWQQKQMNRHYRRFKEQKARADALEALLAEQRLPANEDAWLYRYAS